MGNRPGAHGPIGENFVPKATPGGYTLAITVGTHYALPFVMKEFPYNTYFQPR
ncbi:MAG: hypothetical protein HYU75_26170 [Betaproteobacteria bacterium]|nr:hypothetical protein [Betaproteobacteria bacterium]